MGTVDAGEVERFRRLARNWWDPAGEFAPLHRLNPVRLGFIRERLLRHFARDARSLRPFAGLRLVDIGSGGGLVAEPMARLGFDVTGIDADDAAIEVARAHAADAGLAIDYRAAAVEDLAAAGRRFDAVLALEIAEHAGDQPLFLAALAGLVAPGGALVLSTINRTAKSFALAVIGAEYLLRWLPRGTHRWEKFLRPSEVAAVLRREGMTVAEIAGIVYDPLRGVWSVQESDIAVNYFLFARKPK